MDNTNAYVKVELLNSNGAPTAYVTQPNTMTLRLTNQTGNPIPLQPGTPQAPPPTDGTFEVALYFSAFYTNAADQGSLAITAANFQAQYFGTGPFPGWVVVPTVAADWGIGEALEFTVSGFEPTVPVGTYYLSVALYNLNDLPPQPYSVVVGVANPPDGQKQDLSRTVSLTLDTDTVVVTKSPDEPAVNRYRLTMLNTNPNQGLVPAGTPWSGVKFTLSFAYATAPGYYALTTTDAAGQFQVGIAQDPASGFNAPLKADGPTWVITPKASNQQILGTGMNAGVTFSIDQVVSQFVPGPTLLYLQYNNIPGYNDGFLTIVMNKEYDVMKIASFSAGQTSFDVTGLTAPTAYLNWEVDNAVLVQLDGVGQVPSRQQAYPVTIEQNRSIVLTAYDPILGAVATSTIPFTLEPPISSRWVPAGGIVAWSGAVDAIPTGYQLCDGSNGTPDLRDRFVVGGSSTELPGTSGAPTHTHTLLGFATNPAATTSTDGAHTHGWPTYWYARSLTSGGKTGIDTNGTFNNNTQTQSSGLHSHSLPVNFGPQTSGTNNGGVRPKWYALCYIMLLIPS